VRRGGGWRNAAELVVKIKGQGEFSRSSREGTGALQKGHMARQEEHGSSLQKGHMSRQEEHAVDVSVPIANAQ
jgi:hypothetical protein